MRLAPGLINGIVIGILGAFGLVACLRIMLVDLTPFETWSSLACVVAVTAIQLGYFTNPTIEAGAPLGYAALTAQGVLVFAPIIAFHDTWISLPGFLAGSALLAVRPSISVVLFVAVVATLGVAEPIVREGVSPIVFSVVSTAVTGLVVYGITRLTQLAYRIDVARADIAQRAVDEERLRFERDLHEALGQRLSAVTQRCDRASRLIDEDPEQVQIELSEILDVSRRALADVRAVTCGYRELSLAKVCQTAKEVLQAADIDLELHLRPGRLPKAVNDLLTTALREGVTNVLRHRNAEHCTITIGPVGQTAVLEIVNDGVNTVDGGASTAGSPAGTGVAALSRQVGTLGGEFTAEPERGGRFRLRISLPLDGTTSGAEAEQAAENARGPIVEHMVPRLANAILITVTCGFGLLAAANVMESGGTAGGVALSIVYLAALLTMQLGYFSNPTTRFRAPRSHLALLAQACLIYLPLLQFGNPWIPVIGILGGCVLLALRPPVSVPLFILIALSGGVAEVTTFAPWAQSVDAGFYIITIYSAVATMITGLVVYGLSRLARLVTEIHAVQGDLARMAVASERLRFARDLHDLLGLSLSAITLRSERTYRLMGDHPERARAEVADILGMARTALADARSIATGYRGELSLDDEIHSAESVFAATDTTLQVVREGPKSSDAVDTVLATVLRESVTNVLRHSKANWCEIAVRAVDGTTQLGIINDGVTRREHPEQALRSPDGSGLRNLVHRVRMLGGHLEAGTQPDGTFQLRARVPSDAGTPPATARSSQWLARWGTSRRGPQATGPAGPR